jgi:hypothetical protein
VEEGQEMPDEIAMQTVEIALKDPFVKINYWVHPDDRIQVRAYLAGDLGLEQNKVGMAIDGSASMKTNFGVGSTVVAPRRRRLRENKVGSFAQIFCPELAEQDYDKEIYMIYWATGRHGAELEEIGSLNPKEARKKEYYSGPRDWGTGTQLLPAIRYFVEHRFPDQQGFYVFISDGAIHDEKDVTKYCWDLARRIEEGQRLPVKFFVVGVGQQVDRDQLERLDNMRELNEGFPDVDLWDTALVSDIDDLAILFRELIDRRRDEIVYEEGGRILDHEGSTVLERLDGLPAWLEFALPPGAKHFVLEIGEDKIEQRLFW